MIGSAVRDMTNKLVRHTHMRLYHFAPALSLILLDNQDVRDGIDELISRGYDTQKRIQKYIDSLK